MVKRPAYKKMWEEEKEKAEELENKLSSTRERFRAVLVALQEKFPFEKLARRLNMLAQMFPPSTVLVLTSPEFLLLLEGETNLLSSSLTSPYADFTVLKWKGRQLLQLMPIKGM